MVGHRPRALSLSARLVAAPLRSAFDGGSVRKSDLNTLRPEPAALSPVSTNLVASAAPCASSPIYRYARLGFFLLGLAIVVTGLVLPREWYDAVPRRPELPVPSIDGMFLLRLAFVIDGVILACL